MSVRSGVLHGRLARNVMLLICQRFEQRASTEQDKPTDRDGDDDLHEREGAASATRRAYIPATHSAEIAVTVPHDPPPLDRERS